MAILREFEAHLFYQGKELKKDVLRSGNTNWAPTEYEWAGLVFDFAGVYGVATRPDEHPNLVDVAPPLPRYGVETKPDEGSPPHHALSKNPGEYEIKVLSGGHLARSVKFTVAEDGTIVDSGIATANNLGSHLIIVPVQMIGDSGPWDRTAWKTGAFYGNPLTGFTAPP